MGMGAELGRHAGLLLRMPNVRGFPQITHPAVGAIAAASRVGGMLIDQPSATLLPARTLVHSTRSRRKGEVLRLNRGVYVLRDEWNALAPWQRYRLRVQAHAMWHPNDVFCLESAAVLQGLPVVGGDHEVHVLAEHGATSRRSGGVRTHTAAHADRTFAEVDGIRMTSAADTCIDIARSRHPALALAVADTAVRGDPSLGELALLVLNEERTSTRGRKHARWALHRADPAAESVLESISRASIEWLGFPAPALQECFRGEGDGQDRVDLWWPGYRVAGEADGHHKCDGRFGDPLEALRSREKRDRRLLAAGIRTVVHWTWDDVVEGTPLRAILTGAGVPIVHTPDPGRLATLRRALRGSPTRETATS